MFICFKCHKTFSQTPTLIRHFKIDHLLTTKLLQIQCRQGNCNQIFSNFKSFKLHLEKQHSIQKTFVHTIPKILNADCSAPFKNYTVISSESKKHNVADLNSLSESLNNTHDNSILDNIPTSSNAVQNQNCSLKSINQASIVTHDVNNLKKRALHLTLGLHAHNFMPRNKVLEVQRMISALFASVSSTLEHVLSAYEVNEIKKDLNFLIEFCNEPFSEVKSEYRLFKILKNLKLYEKHKSMVIKNTVTETTVNGNRTLASKSSEIYIMPLYFKFKSIFEIPDLLSYTLERNKSNLKDNVLENFASGELFQKRKQHFNSDLVIPYILYFDDFQINNNLGTHTYSICGNYINFPTMPEHVISKLEYIFHGSFIATKDLKNSGNETSFYHLVEILKLLEEGIEIVVEKEKQKVYFILAVIVGDNLAVNSILGFVQSFNSKRYCRVCTRTKDEMRQDVRQHDEFLRNKSNYEQDLLADHFQETGVKTKCIFNDLKHFHVTENFSFDIMHDVFEGVCVYDICNILLSLIKDNVITLSIINFRKQFFQFGEADKGNNSNPLEYEKLKSFSLKMTASEVMSFVHFLPLMIGDLIPINNEHWRLFTILLQIVDLVLKSQFSSDDLTNLENLIQNHHLTYIRLYGSLKPKHHFLVHYPTAIKKCGPLKHIWGMRFEAKHKEAKIYFNNITSRVNPPHTLAIKSGLKFSKFLLDHENGIESIVSFDSFKNIDLKNEEYFYQIINPDQIFLNNVKIINDLYFKGTHYKSNFYLSSYNTTFNLYKIKSFLLQNENIYVLCYFINIKQFDEHLQSYEVGDQNGQLYIINMYNFNSLPTHVYSINNGKSYVRPKRYFYLDDST